MRRVTPERRYPRDEPFFLQWHITDACNLSCSHCYRSGGHKEPLSLAELMKVLDGFQSFLKAIDRNGRIHLSGGEPFLSPHLFAILEGARDRNIPARVFSNGTLITEAIAGRLVDCGCRLVQISIEGDKDINDQIRGRGVFEKATRAMALLQSAGVEVTVSMTVSKQNVGDIENVAEIAQAHADRFHVARFVPVDETKALDRESALTPSEVCSCFRRMLQVKRSHTRLEMPLRDPLWHEFLRVSPRRYAGWIHGCSIGFNGLALDCDGTVYPCRRLPIPLGNIRTESLSDIWRHSPILQQLRGRDSLKGRCRTCNRRWLCGGCRAMAYALTGDYLEEDPQCIQQCSTIARSLARTRSLWPRSP